MGIWFGLNIAGNIIHGASAGATIFSDPKYEKYIINECEKIAIREKKANPNMSTNIKFSHATVLNALGKLNAVLFGGGLRTTNVFPLRSSKFEELDIEVIQKPAESENAANIAAIKFIMQDSVTRELYFYPVQPPKKPLR